MDEAERCHKLAILERGIKRVDGSPQDLMRDMGAHVVEIAAANIRQLKQRLVELPQVISAAQLGAQLRVLVNNQGADPLAYLRQQDSVSAGDKLSVVRPSLEDVFVTCTGSRRQ
jgi:ABC-2 type transport system ATP-binding protein